MLSIILFWVDFTILLTLNTQLSKVACVFKCKEIPECKKIVYTAAVRIK